MVATPAPEEEPISYERGKHYANALQMLQQESVQRKLASLLSAYWDDVQPIVVEATVQNAGIRQEGLENEIYSCFHHVARGVCVCNGAEEVEREMGKAEDSHLKRVLLDSYKIAIRPCLSQYQFVIEDLYHLSLDRDFNPEIYGADSVRQVRDVLKLTSQIKDAYKAAKMHEACGETEKAIEFYERALVDCGNLRGALEELMKGDVYVVAKAHAASKRAEKESDKRELKIDRRITHIIAGGALLVSIMALIFSITMAQTGSDVKPGEQENTSVAAPH